MKNKIIELLQILDLYILNKTEKYLYQQIDDRLLYEIKCDIDNEFRSVDIKDIKYDIIFENNKCIFKVDRDSIKSTYQLFNLIEKIKKLNKFHEGKN